MNDVPVLDRGHLLEMTGGDEIFEHELIGAYRDSAASLLERLRTALGNSDVTRVASEAHTLKGASLNVGAKVMARCAAAVEEAARAGDLARAAQAARQLDEAHVALLAELERM
jgi:two-component system sensor histidine kinase TorS